MISIQIELPEKVDLGSTERGAICIRAGVTLRGSSQRPLKRF